MSDAQRVTRTMIAALMDRLTHTATSRSRPTGKSFEGEDFGCVLCRPRCRTPQVRAHARSQAVSTICLPAAVRPDTARTRPRPCNARLAATRRRNPTIGRLVKGVDQVIDKGLLCAAEDVGLTDGVLKQGGERLISARRSMRTRLAAVALATFFAAVSLLPRALSAVVLTHDSALT